MVNFRGFFLPKEENGKEDGASSEPDSESDNDDFENPDYHDIIQIARGTYQYLNGAKTRCVAERLRELVYRNGCFVLKREQVIRARFDRMFSCPWWMVELFEIKTSSRTQRTERIPSYSIRCDDGVDKSLLSLFLIQGCFVNQQHAAAFLEFIESRNLRPTFVDLLKNLREFGSSGELNSEIAKQIQTSLAFTPTGKAFLVPELTKVAHRLFPRHVRTLFSSSELTVLQDIAKALESEPWILGYQSVMQEQFGISGCEVKIPSFVNCNLTDEMPVVNRDALYIYNALCKDTFKYGHTFVPLWKLKRNKCYEPPFTPRVYRVTTWEESLTHLREIDVVKTAGDALGDARSVFLPHIRGYEQTIVRSICKMMKKSPWVSDMELDEKVFGGDADQLKAAKLITTSPVAVLSGRGGCGKTHVVSTVLSKALKLKRSQITAESCAKQDECSFAENSQSSSDASQNVFQCCSKPPATARCSAMETPVKEENSTQNVEMSQSQSKKTDPSGDSVLLTAPTGRAASILGKRTGLQSYTLHSVVFSYLRWLKEVKSGEKPSAWKFSDVKLLVCDESSLISVKTFSTLINIIMKKASLQQIILLGDKNQLPSIEPGNFLSDVYQALLPHGYSVTLRTNHRAESQLIVENASRISRQEMPFFPDDPKKGFISLCCQSKQSDDATDSDDMAITQMVRDLLENKISAVTLPGPDKSQFIAFRRRDCLNINELCARHYNQHSIKNPKGKFDFQTGDKVCVKKNIVCFDAYTKQEVKFCNGEIFFIRDVIEEEDNRKMKTTYFALDNGEKIMKVDVKMLKKAKLCHAWARTIHTYQGSEIDTVVYVVGSPIYQTCQHVYTAVTRGVRQVIVVNDPKNLESAVKMKPFARKTKLQQFLASDLQKSSVSDKTESDVEEDVTVPSTSDITSQCLDSDDDNDDVFSSQNRNQSGSTAIGNLCSTQDLQIVNRCRIDAGTNACWEDEFKEEDEEEILAWALEVESSQNQHSGCSTMTGNDFRISRNNLRIKQERRDIVECRTMQGSDSAVEGNSDHTFVGFGDFFADSNTPTVKSEKLDEEKAGAIDRSCSQFSGSLAGLALSAINTFSSSVNQVSPSANSSSVVHSDSPQTYPNRFYESSTFPTPPQTPPNVRKTLSTSTKHVSNTVPEKVNRQRSASFPNSGGTPAKGRRRSFTARYDTWCHVCRSPIRAGVDEITHLESGSSKSWVHQKCTLFRKER